MMFEPYLIDAVIKWNKARTNAAISLNKLRADNPIIDAMCIMFETVVRFLFNAFLAFNRSRLESDKPAWISRYHYDPVTETTREKVVVFSENDRHRLDFVDTLHREYQTMVDDAKLSHLFNTTIFTTRLSPDATRVRLATTADGVKDIVVPPIQSSTRFLAVEYVCGEDYSPVSIDIPKSHYLVGNELLSMEYVLRHLEHLPKNIRWTFNEHTYRVRIIDDDIRKIVLKVNQWVAFTNDGYVVKELKDDDVPTEEERETDEQETEEQETEEQETKQETEEQETEEKLIE